MFKNYWNVTLKNLVKHKLYTLINILGLTVAIASSIIIFLYARNELSYDGFHDNADRIQLVYKERHTATGIQELDDTWVPLLGVMQEQVPGVVSGARVFARGGSHWLEADDDRFSSTGVMYADPAVLDIFTFPLAVGDAETALAGRNSMVLSRQEAEKYFGSDDPIGKTVTIDFKEDYVVTGILEDIPQNSTFRPDIIVPFNSLMTPDDLEAANGNWGNSFLQTFLLLDENVTAASIEAQFPALVGNLFGEEGANGTQNMQLKLWSLRSLHDRATNSNTTSYVLLGIAFSIILIACINFTNLSIARSLERAREVGLRKSLGSLRGQLVMLFFIEPLLITLIALVFSLELASALLPVFNGLYGLELVLEPAADMSLFALLVCVGFAASLLSGCYPALVLSGYRSVDTLKGTLKSSLKGIRIRNGLTFFQFSLAIILITAIIAAWQQVRYMQTLDLHFDPEGVVVMPLGLSDFANQDTAKTRIETFKNELLAIPGVRSVSSSMSVPGNYQEANIFAVPEGWDREEPLRMLVAGVDETYFSTYGMEFVEGANFADSPPAGGTSIILNETAMRDMGWDTAVGKKVNDWTVSGVVRDFNYQSPEKVIRPIIHIKVSRDSQLYSTFNYVSVKLASTDAEDTLAAMEALWRQMDPTRTFNYYFVDEQFESLHDDVTNMGRILGYFALISIFIANLGLLGLSSYSVVQRTKEIGIRKVLGGSVADITLMLSTQFLRPVLLANIVAWPVAWYAINRWLQSFAYHIDLNWLVFPAAGMSILFFALLTVSGQSVKAASRKPVLALRYE